MQSNNLKLYYCHPCQKSVMIELPNLICPACGSDFLQEAKMSEIEPDTSRDFSFFEIYSENDPATRRIQMITRILEEFGHNRVRDGRNLREMIRDLLLHRNEHHGPATSEMLENITTITIETDESAECKICAENFTKGEKKQKLPCKHEYHSSCLEPWLKLQSYCPVCKQHLSS